MRRRTHILIRTDYESRDNINDGIRIDSFYRRLIHRQHARAIMTNGGRSTLRMMSHCNARTSTTDAGRVRTHCIPLVDRSALIAVSSVGSLSNGGVHHVKRHRDAHVHQRQLRLQRTGRNISNWKRRLVADDAVLRRRHHPAAGRHRDILHLIVLNGVQQ